MRLKPAIMSNHALANVQAYYHKVMPFYEEEEEQRADLDFWREIVTEQRPRTILEIGAGSGRITAALRECCSVVALDLSIEMLERAAVRFRNSPTIGHPAYLVNTDMRRFALARKFDLVVAANDPFSHLTQRRERRLALRSIARHLAPGGRLIVEGLYRSERKPIQVPEQTTNGVSVSESWKPFGNNNRWQARYSYCRDGHTTEAGFVARSWDTPEANTIFGFCGLRLRSLWGDFDRRPFTADAERMILVAEPAQ